MKFMCLIRRITSYKDKWTTKSMFLRQKRTYKNKQNEYTVKHTSTIEDLEPCLEPSNLSPGLSVEEGVEGRLASSVGTLRSSDFLSSCSCFFFCSSRFCAASWTASFFFARIPEILNVRYLSFIRSYQLYRYDLNLKQIELVAILKNI